MIKNENILCIGLPNWGGDYMKTLVQVMTVLAKSNRVLYVDYAFTWKDVLFSLMNHGNAPVLRMLGIHIRLRRMSLKDGGIVYVLTLPPIFPVNWVSNEKIFQKLIQLNSFIVRPFIKRALKKLTMFQPVVINGFNPFLGLPLAGAFGEKLLLYYCYDEIKAANWLNKHGGITETEFIKKTDGVITTSESLYNDKSRLNSNTFLVKNGVDFSLFHQAAASSIKGKSNRQNHKQTVGYIGSIDNRLDYLLLDYLAKGAPDIDFIFVGRAGETEMVSKLNKLPNVKMLGAKKPAQLPDFLRLMDVGIIPFIKSEFTRGIYPLKINEYLAAGKPVVMTDFADLKDFNGVVQIQSKPEKFLKAIRHELKNDSSRKQRKRIELAKSASWENRVEQISEVIDKLCAAKGKGE